MMWKSIFVIQYRDDNIDGCLMLDFKILVQAHINRQSFNRTKAFK